MSDFAGVLGTRRDLKECLCCSSFVSDVSNRAAQSFARLSSSPYAPALRLNASTTVRSTRGTLARARSSIFPAGSMGHRAPVDPVVPPIQRATR
jgi:hypothetical protein